MPLRVMSYNIEYGGGDLTGIADAIRASSPDVVGLQEVDVHWDARSAFADQATELGANLGMNVTFARIYDFPNADSTLPRRQFGVALLSRYGFLRTQNDSLTRLSTQDANASPTPMPGLLDATIDVRGQAVRVFNTHLDYRADSRVRTQQVAEMLRYIGTPTSATIVFGDLNAPPGAPELQPLLHLLHDAAPTALDAQLTYPSPAPVKRIDYVLVSPHFQVRTSIVPPSTASDHRPVVVDLLLRR